MGGVCGGDHWGVVRLRGNILRRYRGYLRGDSLTTQGIKEKEMRKGGTGAGREQLKSWGKMTRTLGLGGERKERNCANLDHGH